MPKKCLGLLFRVCVYVSSQSHYTLRDLLHTSCGHSIRSNETANIREKGFKQYLRIFSLFGWHFPCAHYQHYLCIWIWHTSTHSCLLLDPIPAKQNHSFIYPSPNTCSLLRVAILSCVLGLNLNQLDVLKGEFLKFTDSIFIQKKMGGSKWRDWTNVGKSESIRRDKGGIENSTKGQKAKIYFLFACAIIIFSSELGKPLWENNDFIHCQDRPHFGVGLSVLKRPWSWFSQTCMIFLILSITKCSNYD